MTLKTKSCKKQKTKKEPKQKFQKMTINQFLHPLGLDFVSITVI